MKLIWFGYFGFCFEIEQVVILIDFWMFGNLVFLDGVCDDVIKGVIYVLLIYGYGDYLGDMLVIV